VSGAAIGGARELVVAAQMCGGAWHAVGGAWGLPMAAGAFDWSQRATGSTTLKIRVQAHAAPAQLLERGHCLQRL
jgi:hypothetical protein